MEDSKAMEDMVAMATMEITQQVIMDMEAPMITVSVEVVVFPIHESLRAHGNLTNACLNLFFLSIRSGQYKLW